MKTLTDLPSGQLSPDLPAADLRDALVGSGDQGREHVYVGAHITGELDLRWCTVTVPINFKKCTFDSALQLAGAQLASLRLQGGTIAGLDAAHTHFTGDVEMSGGLHVAGQLDLSNSKVDGTLCLMDIAVDERKTPALDCAGATIGGDLLLGPKATFRSPVRLHNATITGNLTCNATITANVRSDAHVTSPAGVSIDATLLQAKGNVTLGSACACDGAAVLTSATIAGFCHLDGGRIGGLDAQNAHVSGDLEISGGLKVPGRIRLSESKIDGSLRLVNLTVQGTPALDCSASVIGGDLLLAANSEFRSAVWLRNATISGNLECKAHVISPAGVSIDAYLLQAKGDVCFDAEYVCQGTVRLAGATVAGLLHFDGGTITKGADERFAVDCEGIKVDQSLLMDGRLITHGPVNLPGANLTGQLVFDGVKVLGDKAMLYGRGIQAQADVYLRNSEVHGRLDFQGSSIKGKLVCDQLALNGSFGVAGEPEKEVKVALDMSGADIEGPAYLTAVRVADEGQVLFVGTHVGSNLYFDHPQFRADFRDVDHVAFSARGAKVDKDLVLEECFAFGTVDLVGVDVGGSLSISGGSFADSARSLNLSRPHVARALNLSRAHVAGVLRLRPDAAPKGLVSLYDAQCAVLDDDPEPKNWPTRFNLDGFTYGTFQTIPPTGVVELRLGWLERNQSEDSAHTVAPTEVGKRRLRWRGGKQGDYSACIYQQLITVLHNAGNEDDARRVALKRQDIRARQVALPLRILYWFWAVTVGYGFALRRVLWWLAGLLAAGSVFFWCVYPRGFAPLSAKATMPAFNCFFYTLDVLVPGIKLGQSGAWVTSGMASYVGWGFTVVGWVLAAAIAAGLAHLIRQDLSS
jgi:hypothetical protein